MAYPHLIGKGLGLQKGNYQRHGLKSSMYKALCWLPKYTCRRICTLLSSIQSRAAESILGISMPSLVLFYFGGGAADRIACVPIFDLPQLLL